MRKGTHPVVRTLLNMLQNAVTPVLWCASTIMQELAVNKTIMKPKVSHIDTCVLSALVKMEKKFNTQKLLVKAKQKQKTSKLGCGCS